MSKIVVTGGAGFVGSHATEYFAHRGHSIVVCDNLSRNIMLQHGREHESYNWNHLIKIPRVELHKIDIRQLKELQKMARSADAIIHAAGQVALTTSLRDPVADFEINALGTLNVLEVARSNDCTVIFCSTNKVYGQNVNAISVKELPSRYSFDDARYQSGVPESLSTDQTGHSPYGSSKLTGDTYVQDYAHTYGLKTGVFRMSCIYGDRQFGVEDQGWLAWFVIATLTGKPITIYGDGKQVRDVLYVDDLVNAFELFLNSKVKHAIFNTGGGPENTVSLLELIDLLKKMTGIDSSIAFGDWRPFDQKVYISDIRRIGKSLGWKPTIELEEGIRRVISWVKENQNLFDLGTSSPSPGTEAVVNEE